MEYLVLVDKDFTQRFDLLGQHNTIELFFFKLDFQVSFAIRDTGIYCIFAIWLSKGITVSFEPLHFIQVFLSPLFWFIRFLSVSALLEGLFNVLIYSFKLLSLHRGLFVRLALEVFALVQIADVVFQEINKMVSLFFVFLEVCRDWLFEVPFNRNYPFLWLLVRNRVIHFTILWNRDYWPLLLSILRNRE
jgi:hypothetical protein